MSYNELLVFCLPSDKNEGICPLALAQSMCEVHNGFMGVIRDREKQMVESNYYMTKQIEAINLQAQRTS